MNKIDICFERVDPTPNYPNGYSSTSYTGVRWDSTSKAAIDFKVSIKNALRITQVGRCCYCRRPLGDDKDTHLEHFIEKSAFSNFTFEPRNLALSCSTCNTQKNAVYRRISSRLSRSLSLASGREIRVKRCPVLSKHTCNNISDINEYRWFHPHLEDFSDHISIRKNWVFVPRTPKGKRCTRSLKLNTLYSLERRAAAERLAGRSGLLTLLASAISETSQFKASEVARLIANEIRRRRAQNSAGD
ncbi:HNH endonuclease [Arenibacterium sp. LLYu02]|uniref:HNH endonuclease n=1 Tax=Arenibacterium sp. LLYu02 TaxID=3404132 RepID=UPI003B20FCED